MSTEADSPATPESGGGFKLAVVWAYVVGSGHQVVTLAISLVMARILLPEVFGVFALANLALLLARVLLRNGMASALIQRKELDQTAQSTGFWILVVLSIVLAGLLCALAPLWSSINGDPDDLTRITQALALTLPISVVNVMQTVVLQRTLNFKALTVPLLLGVLGGGIAALWMAWAGYEIWALVGQQLGMSIVSTVALAVTARWRPTFEFDVEVGRELLNFTGGAVLSSLGEFARNRADTILVGIVLGPVALGIYRFGGRFAEICVEFSVRALQGVLLPGLSRLQGQTDRLRQRILQTYRLTGFLAAVPIAGVFVAVGPILELVGVEKWGASADSMRLLAFAAMFQAIAFLTAPTLQAVGRPYAFAGLVGGQAVVTIAILWVVAESVTDWGLADQVTAVAVGRGITNLVSMLAEVVVVSRICEIPLRSLVRMIQGPVTTTLVAGTAAWLISTQLDLSVWIDATMQGLVIAFAFLALLAFDRTTREMLTQLKPGSVLSRG